MTDTTTTKPTVAAASGRATRPPASQDPGHPKLLAVASGKGGVGKTWFAITLAQTLANQGRRVLLFDGDLGLANVDVQLGLMPARDVAQVLEGKVSLKSAATPFTGGGFDILAGRSGSGNLSNQTPERLQMLVEGLIDAAESYDRVILDLGAGVDRMVRRLAFAAGQALVVTTDEPTALTDAYAFIKLTHAAGRADAVRIIVNMAANKSEGERTYQTIAKACRNFLGFDPPLGGVVRRDARVRDAIRSQTPLLIRSPNSDAASDVEAIVSRLTE